MVLSLKEDICLKRDFQKLDGVLKGRAELLNVHERELVETVLIRGQSSSSLARIIGIPPKTLRSKVLRLRRRLVSRRFLMAARSLPYLSPPDAELAKLHYCQGLSQRKLCQKLGWKSHLLRRRLDCLAAQIETIWRMSEMKMTRYPESSAFPSAKMTPNPARSRAEAG